jgi:hypothetical protein
VEENGGSGKSGEYFGTAIQKRKVHWPKGQVVANLFRAGSGFAVWRADHGNWQFELHIERHSSS